MTICRTLALCVSLAFGSCASAYAHPATSYMLSNEDQEILNVLGEVPEKGMEYIRCDRNHCYYLTTGEYAGEMPTDGIYLVWPTPEYPLK